MEPVIDHIQITVKDLDVAAPFYDKVLGILGFQVEKKIRATIPEHDFEVIEYPHPKIAFAITSPRTAFVDETIHRRKPGTLHHLAFKASSRDEVDHLHHELVEAEVNIVGGPKVWPQHGEDYYAVFFKDPEGLKYEIVFSPHPHC